MLSVSTGREMWRGNKMSKDVCVCVCYRETHYLHLTAKNRLFLTRGFKEIN